MLRLCLKVSKCFEISDKSIMALSKLLKGMDRLYSLRLQFSQSSYITNDGVDALADAIGDTKSLG